MNAERLHRRKRLEMRLLCFNLGSHFLGTGNVWRCCCCTSTWAVTSCEQVFQSCVFLKSERELSGDFSLELIWKNIAGNFLLLSSKTSQTSFLFGCLVTTFIGFPLNICLCFLNNLSVLPSFRSLKILNLSVISILDFPFPPVSFMAFIMISFS